MVSGGARCLPRQSASHAHTYTTALARSEVRDRCTRRGLPEDREVALTARRARCQASARPQPAQERSFESAPSISGERTVAAQCSCPNSALACFSSGMSASAPVQRRKTRRTPRGRGNAPTIVPTVHSHGLVEAWHMARWRRAEGFQGLAELPATALQRGPTVRSACKPRHAARGTPYRSERTPEDKADLEALPFVTAPRQ